MARKETLWGMGLVTAWVVFAVVLVAAISIAAWAFSVRTSDLKGRGNATKVHNSATNRIFQQQQFEDLNAAVARDRANLRSARAALKLDARDTTKQANVTGVQQICNADVAQYNAESRKYLARDFKASDLPAHIELATCE